MATDLAEAGDKGEQVMDTFTSDERIEIAAKVRHANGIFAFVDALGIDIDSDWTWKDVSRRVADLIDPCPSLADEQMSKLRRRSTALASMTRIASDMSGWAGELADSCERMSRARIADDVRRFADRIRQEVRDALN